MTGPFRRPFTELEQQRIRALAMVSFQPATNAKRFARDMEAILAHRPDLGITEKQAHLLAAYCWRFRRQIKAELVPPADPWQAPVDFGPAPITANQAKALAMLVELGQADLNDWRNRTRRREGRGFSFQPDALARRELIEPFEAAPGVILWRITEAGQRALDAQRETEVEAA